MSKARERAYERRRYEEWQAKLSERKRRRRRVQQIVLASGSSLAAVAVIIGVAFLVTHNGDDATDASTAASVAPSASATASSAATPVKGGCTPSTLGAVSSPKQIAKVPSKSLAQNTTWTATFKTTCGTIEMELYGKKAPQAVSSTIALIRSKFYDGTPCHRLTTSGIFVLQCGDPTGTGTGGPGYSYGPLENVGNGKMPPGTVAMARGSDVNSQGSQFFLVYDDTTLDPAQTGGGYTVIGKITKGLDVVKKVAKSGVSGGSGDGAPTTAVSITSATVKKG
ncbi:peptidylprolyl isomerase [Spongisporangium articulatum]|uniref:Peptidylprolyl isomerase n=1 Tax=Spongisporangium articulatum TaxID=3362603 RepID=A0ABW8AR80_9ACTN